MNGERDTRDKEEEEEEGITERRKVGEGKRSKLKGQAKEGD